MQKNKTRASSSQSTQVNKKEKSSKNNEQFELAKIQFLNKVAHELRTPLSVIKMQIEAIEDGMYENNDRAFQQLREKFAEFERLMDKMTKAK
ncbi:histidine kinase dimerization/phospho-acceptor domain-containing protein [Thalassotalea psychrophila]|uniref:histidine kinase n=1 Tax=Thalassotalea psychrophila TaxID=3065647 RepID=A0ABY9TPZ6_9GAMM|nr:histidine kinase dimerization/phospho-acceptor domain-containing protein [Colwelliaceae bacterium SQ149]